MARDMGIVILTEVVKNIIESSESSSESEEDDILFRNITNDRHLAPRPRCKDYVENIIPLYSDEEFQMHFRLRRTTFYFVLELLNPNLLRQSNRYGRNSISPEKQLLIAIWIMATPNSYRCVSDRFDVGKATAWRCVQRVVNALYKKVLTFIRWPTRDEAEETMRTIEQKYIFPGVIGAIDGTHIKITAPRDHSDSYINRKGFHSIQLQVVCDEKLRFIHCYTGQVGSVHDMRVFRLSNIDNMLTPENFPNNSHILGDAAYSLSKYIMVPFKDYGNLSERQIKYNTCHSAARMIVERSLGLLKGRFRSLLDNLAMQRTDLIPKYIIACCILHNICLLKNDVIDVPLIVNANNNIPQEMGQDLQGEGNDKRNAIMYSLWEGN